MRENELSFKTEDYLPARFKNIKEFYDFCIAQDPEFDNAQAIREKGINNTFPQDVDIDGAKMWETALGIKPNASDTLEDRRFRILTKLQQRTPYTWAQLHKMMKALCGEDGYELKKGYFTLMVYLAMDSQSKLKSVLRMLEDVVPMHILLEITQLLEYHFEIGILSYTRKNPNIVILPYQQRKFEDVSELQVLSGNRRTIKLKILPYQQRKLENVLELQALSGNSKNLELKILPYQPRTYKQEYNPKPYIGKIIKGSLIIPCRTKK